ncbi:LysR family transcriptional regulator, regulator of abg operon [Pararobbsia alpina]|uniref:LysR family transcriptional regulator n=1 Tax=Pararobbsia alpina TaxID=621374 RepID=UPI0039A70447
MRPNQLRALIAAVDHGSIRAAARSMFLSQAALTKALRELEDEVEVALINRTTYGIQPTEAGRALYTHASAMDAEMRAAHDAVERLKGSCAGTLRAALSPFTAVVLLPTAFEAFRRRMPDVDLQLVEGSLALSLPRLREGSLDVVVAGATEPESWPDLHHRELCTDEMVPVCRHGHPLEQARTVDELLCVDWLWFSAQTDSLEFERKVFLNNGVPAKKHAVRCSSLTLVFPLLLRTSAIAFLPSRMLASAVVASMVRRMDVPFVMPTFSLRLFTRRHAQVTPPARLLIDCLVDAARREMGGSIEIAARKNSSRKTTH